MNKLVTVGIFSLLILILSACFPWYNFQPELTVMTYNISQGELALSGKRYLPCEGGLKSRVTFPASGVTQSYQVALQQKEKDAILHKSKVGDNVIVEAWCFDKNHKELSYGKVIAPFKDHQPMYSAYIYPPSLDNNCLWTEKRGANPPCIYDSF